MNLIAKTASPGPDVSVPSLGSLKSHENPLTKTVKRKKQIKENYRR